MFDNIKMFCSEQHDNVLSNSGFSKEPRHLFYHFPTTVAVWLLLFRSANHQRSLKQHYIILCMDLVSASQFELWTQEHKNCVTFRQKLSTGQICNVAFPRKRTPFLTLYACMFLALCSSIHDHTDSHCFMKLLQGQLKETLFDWPDSKSQGNMVQKSERILQENKVAYINGETADCVLIVFLFN